MKKEFLKFECICRGHCCVSSEQFGFVFLTEGDLVRLEKFLGKPREEFAQESEFDFTRFSKKKIKCWHLKNSEDRCRFIKDGRCTVYEGRPTQCRTFPFFPEHMNSKTWKKLSQFCPGIGKGPDRTEAEIQSIVDEQKKTDKKY